MQGDEQAGGEHPSEAGSTAPPGAADAVPAEAGDSAAAPGVHRSTVANHYRWRLVIIGLGCLIFAGLCVKDGAFTYRDLQEKREVYETFVADHGPDPAKWAARARELGWPIEEPKDIEEKDILTQWVMFAIVFPIGLIHMFLFIKWSRRYVEGDDSGVRANGGRSFTWDQVTAVDAQKWDRKGIAYIEYDAGGGKDLLVLDDWKMRREPTDAIFELLEENVDADKIDRGRSDTAADEDDAEEAERVSP